MDCFSVEHNINEKYSCVTFKVGEDYTPFLNYLKTLSEEGRYNGDVVDVSEYPQFAQSHSHYFSFNKEYTYAYNWFLPDTVIHDYLKLMED